MYAKKIFFLIFFVCLIFVFLPFKSNKISKDIIYKINQNNSKIKSITADISTYGCYGKLYLKENKFKLIMPNKMIIWYNGKDLKYWQRGDGTTCVSKCRSIFNPIDEVYGKISGNCIINDLEIVAFDNNLIKERSIIDKQEVIIKIKINNYVKIDDLFVPSSYQFIDCLDNIYLNINCNNIKINNFINDRVFDE